jgi:hypothetical protein
VTGFTISKHGHTRFWAVRDAAGELICVCVYKRGALEVARRLSLEVTSQDGYLRETPPEISREAAQRPPNAGHASE